MVMIWTCDTCIQIIKTELISQTMLVVLTYTLGMIVGDNGGKGDKQGARSTSAYGTHPIWEGVKRHGTLSTMRGKCNVAYMWSKSVYGTSELASWQHVLIILVLWKITVSQRKTIIIAEVILYSKNGNHMYMWHMNGENRDNLSNVHNDNWAHEHVSKYVGDHGKERR